LGSLKFTSPCQIILSAVLSPVFTEVYFVIVCHCIIHPTPRMWFVAMSCQLLGHNLTQETTEVGWIISNHVHCKENVTLFFWICVVYKLWYSVMLLQTPVIVVIYRKSGREFLDWQ
jgi:hypothetical protein